MPCSILICDDSSMARKQLARSLPNNLDATISFATNGAEAMQAISAGKGEILFLDLTMPVMDGFEVLQALSKSTLIIKVIVVSGDIQPQARDRVMQLGAVDFIKKPASPELLSKLIAQLEVPLTLSETAYQQESNQASIAEQFVQKTDYIDAYREITNVAIGQAADLLARLLDVFVRLPLPRVNLIELSELQMALSYADHNDSCSAVCQGFIGAGIAGEALLIFHDSSYQDIASKMGYQGEINAHTEVELLMDVANIMIGSCLKGLESQLDLTFSQGHPRVLGQHLKLAQLLTTDKETRWRKTLAIEVGFSVEGLNIECDLLLLYTEQSIQFLNERIAYLVE